jgi:uncharacterized protein YodC (DUF2158 family)
MFWKKEKPQPAIESKASSNWNYGDLVMLKSGGPVMTVDWESQSGHIHCVFFSEKEQKIIEVKVYPDSLMPAPSNKKE